MADASLSRRAWLTYTAALSVAASGLFLFSASAGGQDNSEQDVIDIGSRRELFVDDFVIDKLTGEAELRLHHPTPREIAIVHDEPWEGSGSGYHTVLQDGDLYRMYHRGSHLDVSQGKLSSDAGLQGDRSGNDGDLLTDAHGNTHQSAVGQFDLDRRRRYRYR